MLTIKSLIDSITNSNNIIIMSSRLLTSGIQGGNEFFHYML